MPKVKRSANLSRVARRRIANSDNLPSPATRKIAEVETSGSAEVEDHHSKGNTGSDSKSNVTNVINNDSHPVADAPKTQQLSRGQRKRQAKREQFLKKEKMILSSLMLQRQEEQKKRIDGLDAIKQALMDTTTQGANGQSANTVKPIQHVTTNKAKRKLVAKEIEHVNLILQHPSFKSNPFETMQEHLRNTLQQDREQNEMVSKKRTEEERRKNESKRAEKNGIKRKSQKKKYKPRRTR